MAAAKRSVTMTDVARHAAVSRTTVSFVLGNRPGASIPDETRQRIFDAVAELGYRPNAGARALAAQRTRLLGLVTDIVTGPFAAGIVRGAQDQARQLGQSLLIASTEDDPELEIAAFETMLEHRVEGLIFATGAHRSAKLPDSIRGVPTVMVHCFDEGNLIPSVVPDEVGGGDVATQRLLDAGHRRIGFVNLDPETVAAKGRLEGYQRALRRAGIAPDPRLVRNGHAEADGGYEAASALLTLADVPTALFCGTDRMAMGAYDAIKERGLRIKDDIAVVGFDNQELIADYVRPGLTTVALPFQEMGSRAVSILSTAHSSTDEPGAVTTVRCPLVERASV